MVIGNTETNSLVGTSYAQPTSASHNSAKTSSLLGSDSVHLSSTAEANGFRQQGLSISQIASLMGVTSAEVDTYLHITPIAAVGAVGYGGSSVAGSTTAQKSSSISSSSDNASTTSTDKTATTSTTGAGITDTKKPSAISSVFNAATAATPASRLKAA